MKNKKFVCSKCNKSIIDVMFSLDLTIEKPMNGRIQPLYSDNYLQLCPDCASQYSLNHGYLCPKFYENVDKEEALTILQELVDLIDDNFSSSVLLDIFSLVEVVQHVINNHADAVHELERLQANVTDHGDVLTVPKRDRTEDISAT